MHINNNMCNNHGIRINNNISNIASIGSISINNNRCHNCSSSRSCSDGV